MPRHVVLVPEPAAVPPVYSNPEPLGALVLRPGLAPCRQPYLTPPPLSLSLSDLAAQRRSPGSTHDPTGATGTPPESPASTWRREQVYSREAGLLISL